jgi:Prenyltransferase and squalene oxidase repeat
MPLEFNLQKHVEYIVSLDGKQQQIHSIFTAHLRLNGIYWATTALSLLNSLDSLPKQKIIDEVMACYHPKVGGFGGHPEHDEHLLFTLSAVQILITLDAADVLDKIKVMEYLLGLQNPDGSFKGDIWGEVDTRFSYCALSCASLLGGLQLLDVPKAVEFVIKCQVNIFYTRPMRDYYHSNQYYYVFKLIYRILMVVLDQYLGPNHTQAKYFVALVPYQSQNPFILFKLKNFVGGWQRDSYPREA